MPKGYFWPAVMCFTGFCLMVLAHAIDDSGVPLYLRWPAFGILWGTGITIVVIGATTIWKQIRLPNS
jgi:hypothetical protein